MLRLAMLNLDHKYKLETKGYAFGLHNLVPRVSYSSRHSYGGKRRNEVVAFTIRRAYHPSHPICEDPREGIFSLKNYPDRTEDVEGMVSFQLEISYQSKMARGDLKTWNDGMEERWNGRK